MKSSLSRPTCDEYFSVAWVNPVDQSSRFVGTTLILSPWRTAASAAAGRYWENEATLFESIAMPGDSDEANGAEAGAWAKTSHVVIARKATAVAIAEVIRMPSVNV